MFCLRSGSRKTSIISNCQKTFAKNFCTDFTLISNTYNIQGLAVYSELIESRPTIELVIELRAVYKMKTALTAVHTECVVW